MALVATAGIHHVRLTVTDIDRSRRFYHDVLGLAIAAESAGDPGNEAVRNDPEQLYGGVVFQIGDMLLGLRPVAPAGDRFDSARVGLDHLSFSVDSEAELHSVAARLAAAEIEHGAVTPLPQFGITILSFSDPDGIHLELSAPLR
ncbi:VOC family protein [Nocardia panacis]|uniref:VOC family protein n=1 Tax=Nocardia panacis TaxID=2340916 RepID=A0A3A4KJ34_9NOCA|nr:VOC family protein [Nocardia panacis]RJO79880.1 VOC family protein [Nocardia panacis]